MVASAGDISALLTQVGSYPRQRTYNLSKMAAKVLDRDATPSVVPIPSGGPAIQRALRVTRDTLSDKSVLRFEPSSEKCAFCMVY